MLGRLSLSRLEDQILPVWRRTSSESFTRDIADGSDGLHLTAEGYEPIFNALTKVVLGKWPEMDPETMYMPTPQYVNFCR
jgi:hypothetical protein